MQVGFESGLLSLSAQSRLLQKPGGGCQSPEARGVVPVTEKQPGGGGGVLVEGEEVWCPSLVEKHITLDDVETSAPGDGEGREGV